MDNFLDNLIVDLSAVSLEVLLTHPLLPGHELFDITKVIEFVIHLDGHVAENIEHHGDDNVEDDPLHYDIE